MSSIIKKFISVTSTFSVLFVFLTGLAPLTPQAVAAEADKKILRAVFTAPETGFDPAAASDFYSHNIIQAVFQTLLSYDYLARPLQLVPQAAVSLPEISADGRRYTFHLRDDLYFAPDAAFNGRRQLKSSDFAFAIKRLLDPQINSPWAFLLKGKIIGLDALAKQASVSGKFDYQAALLGLQTPNDSTLIIQLTSTDFNLGNILATPALAAQAPEVQQKYADPQTGRNMAHPVGSGPFMLTNWIRAAKITLQRNPNYLRQPWQSNSLASEDVAIIASMQGKLMPQLDGIEISVIEEEQSRLLSFGKKELDITPVAGALIRRVLQDGQLTAEYRQLGVQLSRLSRPEIYYLFFNFRDPVVGGLEPARIALRRAIFMAHNVAEEIRIVRDGEATHLHFPIPPGVAGYQADYRGLIRYNPKAANVLLDEFGYTSDSKGWRRLPDGTPLTVRFSTRNDGTAQLQEEALQKTFDRLHIRFITQRMPYPDLIRSYRQCQVQLGSAPWIADYPDGDNFMQLLFSENIGQSNKTCASLPDYDQRYQHSRLLPNGPERNLDYREMARLAEVYGLWYPLYARTDNYLAQARIIGYRAHPILPQQWNFIDMQQNKATK